MRLEHDLRRWVHRLCIDIVRCPLQDWLARTGKLLQRHQIDCVVHVGANHGRFATAIRGFGYTGRMISFERLHDPISYLYRKAIADGNWDAMRSVIGDAKSEVAMKNLGMTLMGLDPVFADSKSGQLLQTDAVFF